EALDMLQAMNTGHDGSLTTIHANNPRDAVARMETMALMANLNLPEKAVRRQIASAVAIVIQVARMSDGSRRVTHLTEITGIEDSRGLGVNPDGTTILKQDPLSSNPAVDSLIRRLPGVFGLARLIKHAGQTWQVGSVLLASVIALVVGSWIASFFMPSDILSVLVGVLLAVSPIFYLYILRETRFRKCDALVPEAVDLM